MTDGKTRSLAELRVEIDGIDRQLVQLLERRAGVVVEVGEQKRGSGGPIYAPDREAQVLARALDESAKIGGVLPARTLEAVFREIMSGSFALERPLRIAYLGPRGSFSHQAAIAQFGQSVSYEGVRSIAAVFTELRRGHVDYGLVPIENSTAGSVRETLDAFAEHGSTLHVYAEVVKEIRQALLSCGPSAEIQRIHSKPEALAQCRQFIGAHFPKAQLVPAASTSAAVIHARSAYEAGERGDAAIASTLAGTLHGVAALFEDIEDDPNNLTRFMVLAREAARPSGKDKTSVMITIGDGAGSLVDILSCFSRAGINLSHIDKRPSRRENWSYTFFIDALAHRDDAGLGAALEQARGLCQELTVLGSYPRSGRVL